MRVDLSQIAAVLLLLTPVAGVVRAEPIRAGYELSIRVAMLDPTSGDMRNWEGWPQDYAVDDDGRIVLPVLGGVNTAGISPEDLAGQISDRLIQQLSLASLPAVTVEIAERPPVMVLGLVRQAGPVPFRPGMTVREALAMTGGVPLSGDAAEDPLRARLTAKALLEQLQQREMELSARAARFRAEAGDDAGIDLTPLGESEQAMAIGERERQILALDIEQRKRALDLLEGRLALLRAEIETLNTKSVSLATQQDLARRQLDAMTRLSDSGLTVNARLLEAQRIYTDIEAQGLELRSSILAARQDIAKAEADRLQIVQGGKADALVQLAQTQSDLAETRSRRSLQERLVALIDAAETPEKTLDFSVYHAGSAAAVSAGADQPLQPGDVVQVTLGAGPRG